MKRSYIAIILISILIFSLSMLYVSLNYSEQRDYRQYMRNFIQDLSLYAKGTKPNFIIIPQNGHELLTLRSEKNGTPSAEYLNAIDGVGREDLFYGYNNDNMATPETVRNDIISYLNIAENNDIEVLVTDYCSTQSLIDNSYIQNNARDYISFAADHRDLDNIPEYPPNPYNLNNFNITVLKNAKNFLYLINPNSFSDKDIFLNALKQTNYDTFIIDLFYNDIELTTTEIESLKIKANGGSRLVISYLSIGEAEDYRYYWQQNWKITPPSWLGDENPN